MKKTIAVVLIIVFNLVRSNIVHATNRSMPEVNMAQKDTLCASSGIADMDCNMKIFNFASPRIVSRILIIKGGSAFFRTQNHRQYFNGTYTQVELDINIANKINRLFNEIYSHHESVIKSDLPDVPLLDFSESCEILIEVSLNNKVIKEKFDKFEYYITYSVELGIEPFIGQFNEIWILMNAISYRMEHEFYDFNYNHIDEKQMTENKKLGILYDSKSVMHGFF